MAYSDKRLTAFWEKLKAMGPAPVSIGMHELAEGTVGHSPCQSLVRFEVRLLRRMKLARHPDRSAATNT